MRTRRSRRNQDRLFKALFGPGSKPVFPPEVYAKPAATPAATVEPKAIVVEQPEDALFSCCMPCGFTWCDRTKEEHGDYKRIAFMPYDTMKLEIHSPRNFLIPRVKEDAARLIALTGTRYAIAGNVTITLGYGIKEGK